MVENFLEEMAFELIQKGFRKEGRHAQRYCQSVGASM